MIPEIGNFALALSLAIAVIQSIVPLYGAYKRDSASMMFAEYAAVGQLLFIALSFGCLAYPYVDGGFPVAAAAGNWDTARSLLYKISGAWGSREGSLLLLVLMLAAFGAAATIFGNTLSATLRARVIAVQGIIGAGFLAFILIRSNPFASFDGAALARNGLDFILNRSLALRLPFLYLGYALFSLAFSFSVAALMEGKGRACWIRRSMPFGRSGGAF